MRHGLRANTIVRPDRGPRDLVKRGHVYDCNSCHVDDACRKCHQLNRPKSHTGFWRIRGHGIKGLAERESCINCHVQTFCIRSVCHPRIITRVQVGDLPECLFCHPR
jgi:hypothetical protein